MNRILKALFFVGFLAGMGFAQENASWNLSDDLESEIDSTEIYREWIAVEVAEASYEQNMTGWIVGSSLVGMGTLFGIGGLASILVDESNFHGIGAMLLISAIPFYLVGAPVLTLSIYDRQKHARKRDEYQKAYERCRKRRQNAGLEEVRLVVVPTFDVANAGSGVKLFMEF